MRLFRRRKPAPIGSLRLGEHSDDIADYNVFTVSESRFPESFAQLWAGASQEEQEAKQIRRWATLIPVTDPSSQLIADLAAEIDGHRVAYLRPPHLTYLARKITQESVETVEVPAFIEWGPAGQTVMLVINIDSPVN